MGDGKKIHDNYIPAERYTIKDSTASKYPEKKNSSFIRHVIAR